jgi:hypothetical protein
MVHAARNLLAPALVLAMVLIPFERQIPLDPDQPLAADGSLVAGRARTIFQFDALLGAFDEPRPVNPDDPHDFEEYFEIQSTSVGQSRDGVVDLIEPIGLGLCAPDRRKRLIAAIGTYYDTRSRQKASFRVRGPRASRFIEQAWSTTTDHRIESFVQQLIRRGFLQMWEISPQAYPDLVDLVGPASAPAAACADTGARQTNGPATK